MSAHHGDLDIKRSATLEAQQPNELESSSGARHPTSSGIKRIEDIFDIETDSKWQTTKKELWSYYLYYVGNNGLAGFNYGCVCCTF
jgi:hypothetical protein